MGGLRHPGCCLSNVSAVRVVRGGSCRNESEQCRAAAREVLASGTVREDVGFRVVLADDPAVVVADPADRR